ncbi:unnamed protein product [Rotaria sordida]|uniref:Ubiquitin-like domain-containing protein n=1 Tax=Rotaria sordida TaxID=392033 RepID=A0A814U3V6_9BILA|nr:unnamed protein product [Rotaria sordida]CAF3625675.1 unnamed protein product [Rotaria sordida]
MSVASYSRCRIRFVPNDQQSSERNYSDRTLIELRQYDFGDYSLRAIDVDNNKNEIFNIPFKQSDQYKRRQVANQPDGIRTNNGVYLLWLNDDTRDQFHKALDTAIEQLDEIRKQSPQHPSPQPDVPLKENRQYNDTRAKPPAHKDSNEHLNRVDVLADVYRLGQHIRQGDVDEAVAVSKKLANQHVQLQANPWRQSKEEQIIPIRIQIDSNNQDLSNKYDTFTADVYPSTKIHELRAALGYSNYNLPSNQYFFVNGHLAHENSTIQDLNVQQNSLFILFIIQ